MTNSQKAIMYSLKALRNLEKARRTIPELNQSYHLAVNAAIKAVNEIPVPEPGRIVGSSKGGA